MVTFQAFDQAVAPEMERRTKLLGTLLRADLQRMLELGIPIEAVAGFDRRVSEIVAKFPEVQNVRILTSGGTTILDISHSSASESLLEDPNRAQTYSFAILLGNEVVASIVLTGNSKIAEATLLRVLFDIGIVALAIVLAGVELILVLATRSIWLPREAVSALLDEQRHGRFDKIIPVPASGALIRLTERLNDRAQHLTGCGKQPSLMILSSPILARLPLFLLALGTETTASFLPIMARNSNHSDWLTPAVAAAVPLVAYLVVAAALAPSAGRLVRYLGPRRAFIWSAFPAIAGLVFMAGSDSIIGIILGRMLVAAGYTVAAAACSSYALHAGGRAKAAQTQGAINTALYSGVLAGSVIGGVIAYEAGYSAAVLFGAIVIGISAYTAQRGLSGLAGAPSEPTKSRTQRATRSVAFNAIAFGLAVPASATTAMVIWYMVPLLLSSTGFDAAMIARVVMLYYFAAIFVAPLIGQFFGEDHTGTAAMAGALLSGVALLVIGTHDSTAVLIWGVVGIGIGHAALRAPIFALIVSISVGQIERIDRLRMIERIGAITAFCAAISFGSPDRPDVIFVALGIISLSGVVFYAIMSRKRFGRGGTTEK